MRLHVLASAGSPMQQPQPFVPPPVVMANATLGPEQGASSIRCASHKRRATQISRGQRPSQRAHKNLPHMPMYIPSSGDFTFEASSSSTPQGQPYTSSSIFARHAAPTHPQGWKWSSPQIKATHTQSKFKLKFVTPIHNWDSR